MIGHALLFAYALAAHPEQSANRPYAEVSCPEVEPSRRLAEHQEPFDGLTQHYSIGALDQPLQRVQAERNRRFFSQPVVHTETATPQSAQGLALADGRQFEPDGGYLIGATWRIATPPIYLREPAEWTVAGEVFCGRGKVNGNAVRRYCFRDRDEDGLFDAAADAGRMHGVGGLSRLEFHDIEAQAYRTATSTRPAATEVNQALSLMTSRTEQGQLRILLWLDVDPVLTGFRPGINQGVVVYRSELPAEVELLGARLVVHRFDARTADITMQRPFETGRILFDGNCPTDAAKGSRITIVPHD